MLTDKTAASSAERPAASAAARRLCLICAYSIAHRRAFDKAQNRPFGKNFALFRRFWKSCRPNRARARPGSAASAPQPPARPPADKRPFILIIRKSRAESFNFVPFCPNAIANIRKNRRICTLYFRAVFDKMDMFFSFGKMTSVSIYRRQYGPTVSTGHAVNRPDY